MKVIYAIPGIGTTKKLFQNLSVQGYTIEVLNWPPTKKEYSLQDYAKEFLKQVNTDQPVNLIGVSFGGMLCAAMAKQVKTEKVVLISSCGSSRDLPLKLRSLKYFPAYKLIPDNLIRLMARTKRKFLGFERSFDPDFQQMISQMPQHYFSRCIQYIINWDEKESGSNIIYIHGTNDRLLPPPKFGKVHLIKGGSHAMVLNKATEINVILNKEFNGL